MAMTPEDAIFANVNGQLSRDAMYRLLLTYAGWRVPRPPGAIAPTIIVNDAAGTPSSWVMSTEDAYQAACREFTAEAIGPVSVVAELDDVIVELDERVVVLRVDPGARLSLNI